MESFVYKNVTVYSSSFNPNAYVVHNLNDSKYYLLENQGSNVIFLKNEDIK